MANLEKQSKGTEDKKKGGMASAVNSTEKIRTWVSHSFKFDASFIPRAVESYYLLLQFDDEKLSSIFRTLI